jgi:hypothetical protein
MKLRVVMVAAALVFGCSSSSNGGAGGAPICAKGTFQLSGTLDGATANGSYGNATSYFFENALNNTPGDINAGFGTNGQLHLSWPGLVADGQSTQVTGTLTMPSEGPHPGAMYCITAGSMTVNPPGEDGASFSITGLASGACPGTPVTASLTGCVASNL